MKLRICAPMLNNTNLLRMQRDRGSPVNPMGHVQLEACARDVQMALVPQGCTWHASRHVPSTHLCGSGQSRSDWQPGNAVTVKEGMEKMIKKI